NKLTENIIQIENIMNDTMNDIDTFIMAANFSTTISEDRIRDEQKKDEKLQIIVNDLSNFPYYSLNKNNVLLYQDGKLPLKTVVIPASLIEYIITEYHHISTSDNIN